MNYVTQLLGNFSPLPPHNASMLGDSSPGVTQRTTVTTPPP